MELKKEILLGENETFWKSLNGQFEWQIHSQLGNQYRWKIYLQIYELYRFTNDTLHEHD